MYFSLDIIVTIVYNVSKSREEIQRNEKIQFIKHYEKSMGETMEEKLIRLGYKVWEKGDMKRIYINDFQKYLEVEETNTPAAMGRGRIINGICTDEYKSFAQRQALNLVDWGFGAKLYYDCKKEDWGCKNPGSNLIKKILWTVVDKIVVL